MRAMLLATDSCANASGRLIGTSAAGEEVLAKQLELLRPAAGGLMHDNSSYARHLRAAAAFIDKILRGARPNELPVQQPTAFELTINLQTARMLGLTLPQALLLRATELLPAAR
jgi:putative ABC transport system substrate-binding protein